MKRDAQATRRRILEAATAEFSRYGVAGARIDRIAAASGSNKSMIYAYFESKERLLSVVAETLIAQYADQVPLDVRDLPEFAARLYDQNRQVPEVPRLIGWSRLEGGETVSHESPAAQAHAAKVRVIAQAQQAGLISARLPSALLFEFIVALTQAGGEQEAEADQVQRRQAIKDAVDLLVTP